MSLTNQAAPPPVPRSDVASVDDGIERAVALLAPHLEQLIRRSAPTAAVLKALADELARARSKPSGVTHPELVDPDVFWARSAWPQAAAVVRQSRSAMLELAGELADTIRGAESVLDAWLVGQVAASANARRHDPIGMRNAAIDGIVARCEAMHRVVERVVTACPSQNMLGPARVALEQARHRHAAEDVKHSRDAAANEQPDVDRATFKRMWADSFDQRVAAREQELRRESPYRHQELLLHAFGQAIEAMDTDLRAMARELTSPIIGIGERLVRRYDELAASTAHAAASPAE